MMGIEPMSEDSSIRSATIIVGILNFPQQYPCRQGYASVASSYFFYSLKALRKKFPALFDALFTGAGTCGRTVPLN